MIQTPNNLDILLHCYYSPERHPRFVAPAVQTGIDYLLAAEMIEPTRENGVYKTTPRGEAFIDHVMQIPFPVAVWTVPNG